MVSIRGLLQVLFIGSGVCLTHSIGSSREVENPLQGHSTGGVLKATYAALIRLIKSKTHSYFIKYEAQILKIPW